MKEERIVVLEDRVKENTSQNDSLRQVNGFKWGKALLAQRLASSTKLLCWGDVRKHPTKQNSAPWS